MSALDQHSFLVKAQDFLAAGSSSLALIRFRRKTNEIAKFTFLDESTFTILEKIWTKIRSLDNILDEIGDVGWMKNNSEK